MLKRLVAPAAAELEAMPADSDWSGRLDELANTISLEEAERLIDELVIPKQIELGVDITSVSH
jgi:hypothetical protein